MAIPKGANVRQIVVPIEGVVENRRFREDADCLEYLVESRDADGNTVSRWFLEAQIERVEA